MAYAQKVKESNDFKSFPRGLKDGANRRRVLPGIHTCSEDGTWASKHSTHTYAIPREGDPEKKDYVTFNCVEVIDWVNREKVVLESCPECVIIEDQNTEYTRLKTKLMEEVKAGLKTKDEVRKLLRPFVEWKKRHGRSFWWAVNVVDGDGKYFTEKWPNDVKKQFDVIKKKLKDEDNIGAILPISQGIWIDITKTPSNETGTGFPEYKVEVVWERMENGGKREKLAPLPPESSDEAEKSCWDITNPGIVTLTRDQVKALAASGDAPAVLRGIFAQATKVEKPKTDSSPKQVNGPVDAKGNYAGNSSSTTQAPEPTPTPAPASTIVPKAEPEESEDERIIREANAAVAAAQARRAALRTAAAPAATSTPAAAAAPKVDPSKPAPKADAPKTAKTSSEKVDDDIEAEMRKFEAEYKLGEE